MTDLPVKFGERLLALYDDAVRAIVACATIEEAKYESNKADALAALAKVEKDKKMTIEAKRLKLWAHRRMGEIALELRPITAPRHVAGQKGSAPGARSLLREHGFTLGAANSILRVASLPQPTFNDFVAMAHPPTPASILCANRNSTQAWTKLRFAHGPFGFRSFCRANAAKELATGLTKDEALNARKLVLELNEWLDEFEQHLPKEKP